VILPDFFGGFNRTADDGTGINFRLKSGTSIPFLETQTLSTRKNIPTCCEICKIMGRHNDITQANEYTEYALKRENTLAIVKLVLSTEN